MHIWYLTGQTIIMWTSGFCSLFYIKHFGIRYTCTRRKDKICHKWLRKKKRKKKAKIQNSPIKIWNDMGKFAASGAEHIILVENMNARTSGGVRFAQYLGFCVIFCILLFFLLSIFHLAITFSVILLRKKKGWNYKQWYTEHHTEKWRLGNKTPLKLCWDLSMNKWKSAFSI